MTTRSVLHIAYVGQTFIVCLYLFLHFATTAILQNCLPGYFYDDVLDRCESCYLVCVDAALQRTEEKCAQCRKVEAPPNPSPAPPTETTPVWVLPVVVTMVIILILVPTLILAFRNIRPLQTLWQNFQTRLSQQDVREISNGEADGNMQNESLLVPAVQESNEAGSYVKIDHPQHDPENQADYERQRNMEVAHQQMINSSGFRVFTTPESDQATSLENFELIGETEMTELHETDLKTL
ncbi:hypothetical protein ACJMK2_033653 [Sinanodonta woodiana]|uniref:Uncharacterized protein n=1 Tax=Sinanodonta woodiana TaxID=1069815 RepID=A0ABD3WP24_SINWO